MQEINKKNARVWSMLGQRGTVCGKALPEILEQHENAVVITADLATLSGLERVKEKYAERFYNVGIAEQNMIGVAAGMAFEGDLVYVTTYATFLSMRCYEQIRHNLGYQQANVKLIGSAAGLAMGMSGNTHYAMEDIALMRAMPNMTVISPADASEAYLAIYEISRENRPAYLRLTGNLNTPVIYRESYNFELGKGVVLRDGKDIALIATGTLVHEALQAAKMLEESGISATVIDMHTLKPIDEELIYQQGNKQLIVTIEEHNIIGGLGSAVADVLAVKSSMPPVVKIGITDKFVHPSAYEELLDRYGLTAKHIYQTVLEKRRTILRDGR